MKATNEEEILFEKNLKKWVNSVEGDEKKGGN